MSPTFEIAGGTVPGRAHLGRGPLLYGRNNQDAYGWRIGDGWSAAVVCDGCGSGSSSELGAQLGVRGVLGGLQRRSAELAAVAASGTHIELQLQALLTAVGADLLFWLEGLIARFGGDRQELVRESLLFTVVGAVLLPDLAAVFSLGDGVYAVNGEVEQLGPFPDNAPPYLGQALLDAPHRQFAVHRVIAGAELDSLMVGTDGVADLIEAGEEGRLLPGREEPAVPLHRFWTDDRYFRNPDAIRRYLALANSQPATVDELTSDLVWHPGLLTDDTTLVVARRRPGGVS